MRGVEWASLMGRRLRTIMDLRRREQRHPALKEHAQKLGCSLNALIDVRGVLDEPELIRRIQEAERSRRESLQWIVVVGAIAALVGALAVWAG